MTLDKDQELMSRAQGGVMARELEDALRKWGTDMDDLQERIEALKEQLDNEADDAKSYRNALDSVLDKLRDRISDLEKEYASTVGRSLNTRSDLGERIATQDDTVRRLLAAHTALRNRMDVMEQMRAEYRPIQYSASVTFTVKGVPTPKFKVDGQDSGASADELLDELDKGIARMLHTYKLETAYVAAPLAQAAYRRGSDWTTSASGGTRKSSDDASRTVSTLPEATEDSE
jgi:polyhydroxyalkanoate synthesis regulator phasin